MREETMRMMRRIALTFVAAGLALAATATEKATEKADARWQKLKSLAGDWEGTVDGKPGVRVSYELASNGTALIETLNAGDSDQMITVYHPDGSSLLMTHYCSVGIQSRMRAKGFETGRLAFDYVDATNLRGAGDHVMTRLVLSFPDADRLVQEWTSRVGTREHVGRFEFKRRK